MASRTVALLLFVLGVVLLLGPFLGGGVPLPESNDVTKSPRGYTAHEIDVSNDSEMATRFSWTLTVQASDLRHRHHADEYEAKNATASVLEAAIRDGSAATETGAVERDLDRIRRNYSLVTLEYETFYRFAVEERNGGVAVTTTPVNDSEIAALARSELIANYSDLPDGQQNTFRKIRNATRSDGQIGYRPWSNETLPEKQIVEFGGRYYHVSSSSTGDSLSFPLEMIGLALIGLVCLVVATALVVRDRRRSPG